MLEWDIKMILSSTNSKINVNPQVDNGMQNRVNEINRIKEINKTIAEIWEK